MSEIQIAEISQYVKEIGALKVERDRLEEENARLTGFALKLAERIFAAHEVLGRLAERKDKR